MNEKRSLDELVDAIHGINHLWHLAQGATGIGPQDPQCRAMREHKNRLQTVLLRDHPQSCHLEADPSEGKGILVIRLLGGRDAAHIPADVLEKSCPELLASHLTWRAAVAASRKQGMIE